MMRRVVGSITTCLLMAAIAAHADEKKPGYLGIATVPVDSVLAEHLGLGNGVGLTVTYVDADGPSASVLKKDDVLRILEGQILVNHDQLVTLVQQVHNAGDEVNITFVHRGKEKTAKVVLGEAPADLVGPSGHPRLRMGPPPMQGQPAWPQWGPRQWQQMPRWEQHWHTLPEDLNDLEEHIQDVLKGIKQRHGCPGLQKDDEEENDDEKNEDADVQVHSFSSSQINSKIVTSDGHLKMTLESNGESKHLKAERDGKVLFDGDVNTDEERKLLPDDVRGKLEDMEKGVSINIKASSGVKGKKKSKHIKLNPNDRISI